MKSVWVVSDNFQTNLLYICKTKEEAELKRKKEDDLLVEWLKINSPHRTYRTYDGASAHYVWEYVFSEHE